MLAPAARALDYECECISASATGGVRIKRISTVPLGLTRARARDDTRTGTARLVVSDAILCLSNQCQRHGRRAQVTGLAGTGTTDRHESGSSEDEDADCALRMFNYGYNNAGSTALGLQSGTAGEEEVSRGGQCDGRFPSAALSSWDSASSPAGSNVDRHASVCLLLFAVDGVLRFPRDPPCAARGGGALAVRRLGGVPLQKRGFPLAALLTLSTMFVLSPWSRP